MKNKLFFLVLALGLLSGCIKDDIINDVVEPTLRIDQAPDSILINTTYQLEFTYLNEGGFEEAIDVQWESSNPEVLTVDDTGLVTAIALGSSDVSATYDTGETEIVETITLHVGMSTVESVDFKSGSINTTSSYTLEGDFELTEVDGQLLLEFFDDYRASSSLPGLYLYLSNNPNTVANAFEVSRVNTFNGAHTYAIEDIGIDEYRYLIFHCKPFNVQVGTGEIQ